MRNLWLLLFSLIILSSCHQRQGQFLNWGPYSWKVAAKTSAFYWAPNADFGNQAFASNYPDSLTGWVFIDSVGSCCPFKVGYTDTIYQLNMPDKSLEQVIVTFEPSMLAYQHNAGKIKVEDLKRLLTDTLWIDPPATNPVRHGQITTLSGDSLKIYTWKFGSKTGCDTLKLKPGLRVLVEPYAAAGPFGFGGIKIGSVLFEII
jgi:hypothetical protein